jgi:hypothetical protein
LVLRDADFWQRKQYGEMIIDVVRYRRKLRTTLSTNFYGGKETMKTRIISIMDTKQKKAGIAILCVAVVSIIFSGIMLTAATRDNSIADGNITSNNQTEQISADGAQTWMADIKIDITQLDKVISDKEKEQAAERAEMGMKNYIAVPEEKMLYPKTGFTDVISFAITDYYLIDGRIEPHILDNGEKGVYCNSTGNAWSLKAGNVVEINILADAEYFNSAGRLMAGYIKDDEYTEIGSFYIDREKNITFEVPESGDYKFYLLCEDFDPIIIKWMSIVTE